MYKSTSIPLAAWILIAVLSFGVIISTSSSFSNLKALVNIQEGIRNQDDDEKKTFTHEGARIRDNQGDVLASAIHDGLKTVNEQAENEGSIGIDDIRYLLNDYDALEEHERGDRKHIENDISQQISRGKIVSQEDMDSYLNSRGYYRKGSENYYFSKNTDEYSINDFERRMSHVMPESYSRHGSRHLRPSRDEMQRGITLDKSFSDSFNHSRPSVSSSPLLSDTHLSSHDAPNTYMLSDSPSTSNMSSLNNPASSLKLPSTNDPYALQEIARSQIPVGDEDKYILKSKIVPPVCPACPNICPKEKGECPPCPPCERCPEPDVECKRVPTYKTTKNKNYPMPILSDFSQFGM